MVRMPESRPYHHGDLRAALLAGAERTLREKGAAALSLRELARETGVSHAAPGRHFKDKQALLDALALTGFERLTEVMATADDPALPVEERLTRLAAAYLGFTIENAALLELMYARKHDPDVSQQLAAAVERAIEPFVRLIEGAQQRGEIVEGDPEHITLLAGATLHGVAAFTAQGTLPPQAALDGIDEVVHHLLHGLRPR
ncbi:TetR/AcrR family transcriptional regulator [Streptomyces sp. PSKA30]|uniref:TetR/AcrR family transcriptional regulator n=1 Tax=Streptomyces sp. PSKA30 TaxID=2874597 RepID=UPI001CD17066|nr:TetR/AcrR family transcriptional regulator [Streptomyces sp. PSKA30]MBZ9640342.1 TetR/AcrR family transcriptional regulator [Streptomyces sp. PSKA30]